MEGKVQPIGELLTWNWRERAAAAYHWQNMGCMQCKEILKQFHNKTKDELVKESTLNPNAQEFTPMFYHYGFVEPVEGAT